MSFKRLLLFSTTMSLLALPAIAKDEKLSKFCSETFKHHALSQFSRSNGGRLGQEMDFVVHEKSTGREIIKIVDQDRILYRGCSQPINWMKQVRSALCNYNIPKSSIEHIDSLSLDMPSSIVFLFEGAADFNSSKAKAHYRAANIDGSEGDDLGVGNFNGGNAFWSVLRGPNTPFPGKAQVHYHASSGFHSKENLTSAKACFNLMDSYLDILEEKKQDFTAPKTVVFGYSNGAYNALRFQATSEKVERDIDLLFTIDPIPQTALYPVGKVVNLVKSKKKSTKRLVNLYQTDDYNSVPILKLRGKAVKNADVNIHVSIENSPLMSEDGKRNHVKITRSRLKTSVLMCEVKSLFESENSCEYLYN